MESSRPRRDAPFRRRGMSRERVTDTGKSLSERISAMIGERHCLIVTAPWPKPLTLTGRTFGPPSRLVGFAASVSARLGPGSWKAEPRQLRQVSEWSGRSNVSRDPDASIRKWPNLLVGRSRTSAAAMSAFPTLRNRGTAAPKAAVRSRREGSDFGLFRDLEGVVHLDSQVSHGAFKFAVAE